MSGRGGGHEISFGHGEPRMPRSRRELNALEALGRVLDKPRWWAAWTTQPGVRGAWLDEGDAALVRAHVSQVLDHWPDKYRAPGVEFEPMLAVADLAAGDEKRAAVDGLVQHVLYPTAHEPFSAFIEGKYYETDEAKWGEYGDSHDEDDDVAVPTSSETVSCATSGTSERAPRISATTARHSIGSITGFAETFRHHRTLDPFCQIAWYATMSVVRDRLRGLPLSAWTRESVDEILPFSCITGERRRSAEASIARATELVLAVTRSRDEPCAIDALRSLLPDETRPNVLRLLRLHLKRISAFLKTSREDITAVLDSLVERLSLTQTPSRSGVNTPGPVPHTWLRDDLIPDVRTKFAAEIAALENVPDDRKDWHPTSDQQVLNLVDPSLYCGAIDWTPLLAERPVDLTQRSAAQHMRSIMGAPTSTVLTGQGRTSFQWLPSEFEVSEDGTSVAVRSYINNLHPETHAALYDSIAAIFCRFVALLENVLSTLNDELRAEYRLLRPTDSQPPQEGASAAQPRRSLHRLLPPCLAQRSSAPFSLKGSTCQVIVEISEIQLTPERPEYAGSQWHAPGTEAERLVASGQFCFASENVSESRLSFRRFVKKPRHEFGDYVGVGLTYGLEDQQLLFQDVGSVAVPENRGVVVPNVYQQKLEPFRLLDPSKSGVHKALTFYLVEPTHGPIPSTAVVPPQQEAWIRDAIGPELTRLGLADNVSARILAMAGTGKSLESAKAARLRLMHTRTPPHARYARDDWVLNLS